VTMPKSARSTSARARTAKKSARKAVANKTAAETTTKSTGNRSGKAKGGTMTSAAAKRPRARVITDHPGNLVADPQDQTAIALIAAATAKSTGSNKIRSRRSAVDRLDDAPTGETPAISLVQRVGDAIERELEKIERIIGGSRTPFLHRAETESRARVLASLARTLKEVTRLRAQERGAEDDKAKVADDDAVPRDLDEFRRELSRRLEGMVAAAAPVSAGRDESG
jgi:hypothetical protein